LLVVGYTGKYSSLISSIFLYFIQEQIEAKKPGATIIPIILSSDKTQLTLFCNKSAYPFYLTIGNIPKHIRSKPSHQAQILLGYLSTACFEHILGEVSCCCAVAAVYHATVTCIIQPIILLGESGIHMARENGTMYCCHPIFAISVSDYPEQCLVTPTINGECPTGTTPYDKLGNFHPKCKCPPHDLQAIQDALGLWPEDQNGFYDACKALRIKPIAEPFWRHLLYVNIYLSITPDILHQLYQGVIKHLVAWIRKSFGNNEIDAHCRQMPLNYGTCIFTSGISPLSHVTGKEHQEIC
jgi:hypothetical protein